MSHTPSISPTGASPVQFPRVAGGDADGDNDGSKAAAITPVTPQPQAAKPTAALGNNVNTYA